MSAKTQEDPTADLLTMREAAELARVTRQRISQAAHEGSLAYVPFGIRCIRFYRRDVLRWIKSKRRDVTRLPKGYAGQLD